MCGLLVFMTTAFGYRAYMVTPTASADAAAGVRGDELTSSSSGSNCCLCSGELALEVKGYVTPIHQIQVSPKVSGQLMWLDPRV